MMSTGSGGIAERMSDAIVSECACPVVAMLIVAVLVMPRSVDDDDDFCPVLFYCVLGSL